MEHPTITLYTDNGDPIDVYIDKDNKIIAMSEYLEDDAIISEFDKLMSTALDILEYCRHVRFEDGDVS